MQIITVLVVCSLSQASLVPRLSSLFIPQVIRYQGSWWANREPGYEAEVMEGLWESVNEANQQCGMVSVIPACVMLVVPGLQDRHEP